MNKFETKPLVGAAFFTALGVLFPQLFHLFGAVNGRIFLPMHIPVLLCGFLCGKRYGALCGLIVPLISSAATGMPVLYPTGIAMMAELAVYGFVTGLLSERLSVYPSLVGAMLAGRAVSGAANLVLLGMAGKAYTLEAFVSVSFLTAAPGIAIQLAAVPLLVAALKRAGLLDFLRPART